MDRLYNFKDKALFSDRSRYINLQRPLTLSAFSILLYV